MKKILSISFLVVLTLTGCRQVQANDNKNKETINIEHAMGNTDVPTSPQRIVTLTNESTEAILALGIIPVGAPNAWIGEPFYDYMSEDLAQTKAIGLEGQPNLEAIAKLNPDLIIANKMRNEDIKGQLNAIAPTVYSESIRGNWKENFKFYSKVVSAQTKGEELMIEYNTKVEQLHQKLSEKGYLNGDYSVIRFMDGATRFYLQNSFSGVLLKDLGIEQTLIEGDEDFALEVTKEMLADKVGDNIIYFTFTENDSDAGLDQQENWLNDPLIKSLDAVKNDKVYEVNDITWNTGGGIISAFRALDDVQNLVNE